MIFNDKQSRKPGGIGELLPIAVPMILSSVFETLMMFIDRLCLAHVDKESLSACLSSGLMAASCQVFFLGVLSYAAAIVARYYGAEKKQNCQRVVYQGIYLGLLAYPISLLVGWLASYSITNSGHDPYQLSLEKIYFWWMIFGGIFALLRTPIVAYFAGIGQTGIVMKINIVSMMTNVVADYILIFGKFGFPRMNIMGAAIGTLLACLIFDILIFIAFKRHSRKPGYACKNPGKIDWDIVHSLVRFGVPNGFDGFLSILGFNLAVWIFHGLGADIAGAVSIVMSWDLVIFFPMIGIQAAVTTTTSQWLGREQPEIAEKSAYSGTILALSYGMICTFFLVFHPELLVRPFVSAEQAAQNANMVKIAIVMARMAAIYVIFDTLYMSFSGALRGGGDTLVAMYIMVCGNIIQVSSVYVCVRVLECHLYYSWLVWMLTIALTALVLILRFLGGKWKSFKLIKDDVANNVGESTAAV